MYQSEHNSTYNGSSSIVAGQSSSYNGFYSVGTGTQGQGYMPVWNRYLGGTSNLYSDASLASYVNLISPTVGGILSGVSRNISTNTSFLSCPATPVYAGMGRYQTPAGGFINRSGYTSFSSYSMVPGFVPSNPYLTITITNDLLKKVKYTITPRSSYSVMAGDAITNKYYANNLMGDDFNGVGEGELASGASITLYIPWYNILNYDIEFLQALEGKDALKIGSVVYLKGHLRSKEQQKEVQCTQCANTFVSPDFPLMRISPHFTEYLHNCNFPDAD